MLQDQVNNMINNSGAGNNFRYVPNGSGGINYFMGSKPITNTAYGLATGIDYGLLERQAASEYAAPSNTSRNEGGGSAVGTSGVGRTTAPAYNPADMAYLDDQAARLQKQQASADRTLNDGITQLNDSFNKETSNANTKRSQAIEDFAVKREDTTRGKDRALNTVDTNARTLANSLRLKLGMASGSDSTAYQLAAPSAVNRQATTQRTGVVENFGENFRDLETGEKRAMTAFEELLADLAAQKKSRESDFRGSILERKNQIDTSLSEIARQRAMLKGGGYNEVKSAMAPYAGAIDSRQSEIDNLFEKFRTPYQVKAVDAKPPSLRDYTVDRATIGATQAQGEDPYSTFLQRKKEEEGALL